MAKRQIETPVNNHSIVTSRSLNKNHPDNLNLYESDQEFQDLLKEVKIRFDTNPHFYLKEDYQKLIELIRKKGGSGGDIDVDITGDGNVVTNITSDGNTLNVTKGQARYPRARWARKGFIDLTNCKDIDYIIVPCTSKLQCLYVTNDYLKKLRHVETYESIYNSEVRRIYGNREDIEAQGYRYEDFIIQYDSENNPILPDNFYKIVSKYWDHYILKLHTYVLPRLIYPQDDLIEEEAKRVLPADYYNSHFINCKEFCVVRKKPYETGEFDPLKLLYYRKDVHNGFILFPYFAYDRVGLMHPSVFEQTKFIFTPYMVFANPFNSTLGGVIPVKDGKLLIEKATILKNKTLELVSTGLLIRFDEYGICDTQFNPETYIYTTMKACRGLEGRAVPGKHSIHTDRKVIIRNKIKSPRQGCSNRRHTIRLDKGMAYIRRRTLDLHNWLRTLKWYNLFPRYISKKEYKNLNGLYSQILFLDNTLRDIYLKSAKRIKWYPCHNNPVDGYVVFNLHRYLKSDTKDFSRYTCSVYKRYKAPYDRMNMYTINRHAQIIREVENINLHLKQMI